MTGPRGAAVAFLVSTIVAFGAVELASRALAEDRYRVWPPGYATRFDAGEVIAGVGFPSRLTINALGMRGTGWAEARRHVLAVGGSTTICVYLDDEKAWPHRTQVRLNEALGGDVVAVGNVGRPGHTTAQHALQVEKLLAQHPEIDDVLLLVGVNDLLVGLAFAERPAGAPPVGQATAHEELARAFSLFPDWSDAAPWPWYRRNFVGRLLWRLRWRPLEGFDDVPVMDEKGAFVERMRGYRRAAGSLRAELPDLEPALAAYARRLDRILDAAEARGVRVFPITQPTLWRTGLGAAERDSLWAGGPPLDRLERGAPYFDVAPLAEGMRRYNETLLEVCQRRGAPCLDLAAEVPRTAEVFYDGMHLTERGAEHVAERVAAHLLAHGVGR